MKFLKIPSLNRETLTSDLRAGVTLGITGVPDGMASGVLAGANPVVGLHAQMIGLSSGALFTSSEFMAITPVSAMTLASNVALNGLTGEARLSSLLIIALLVGIIMLAVGLLRLGSLARFFSTASMTGFITGISVLIILSQLGDLTGVSSSQSNLVLRAVDIIAHSSLINWASVAVGLSTIGIALLLDRTRLRDVGLIIGVVLPSIIVIFFNLNVMSAASLGVLKNPIPYPQVPDFSLVTPNLVTSALGVAIIGLVQTVAVGQTTPNPNGRYPDPSEDFVGTGIANIGLSFLQGLPVGGVLSTTALGLKSGAKTRLANFSSGLIILVVLVIFGSYVQYIALPTLAGLLILVGFSTFRRERILLVWRTNVFSAATMVITFIATLALPVQYAIFIGVAFSGVLYIYRTSLSVRLAEVIRHDNFRYEEIPAPKELQSRKIAIIAFYGSLFYASARIVEDMLPNPEHAERPVVIFRMHSQNDVSATFIGVMDRYAKTIQAKGGRLILAGVTDNVLNQLSRTREIYTIGEENIFLIRRFVLASVNEAYKDAEEWLKRMEEFDQAKASQATGGSNGATA